MMIVLTDVDRELADLVQEVLEGEAVVLHAWNPLEDF